MKTLMMIRRMKEVLTWVWIAVIGTAICLNVCAQTPQDWKRLEKQLNFYMANDLGRNGYYDQKPIAELMGEMADVIGPECVFAAGDVHHFEGVRSVNDPLWMTNYELIYSHPELMTASRAIWAFLPIMICLAQVMVTFSLMKPPFRISLPECVIHILEYKGKKYPSFLFKKGRPVPEFRRYLQIEKLFIS